MKTEIKLMQYYNAWMHIVFSKKYKTALTKYFAFTKSKFFQYSKDPREICS